ncbi:Helicase conserved C-terminal domain-containing protein [Desulfurella multipotens]|uniref:Helicase conserved C-terminal domain-containing protein n=2 Tax=Desulfurella TaxID=33001 RepID=A0A1G6Q0G2_9BACT|nr:type I restriction-modification enzyme R subunit C-terminal domain-containing protein [Desulfurella multipotens]SDC85952.1 Helicase conserved C-terminal domain-containing protein [Desulfurella multipotens]
MFDIDERKKIELDRTKKLKLEQMEKKYLSEERAMRIAEEIKNNTEYGEKMILFGVSQAHCLMLANAINKLFEDNEEVAPRYAEAIISDNGEVNTTLKEWFKNPNRKPYIAVSVDIMSTGVDIPCVRYIGFSALTKSVGKYIQMLGRGTRLDPKSGKFSFTVLDFVGLCKRMEDNGKGTPKENKKIVKEMVGGRSISLVKETPSGYFLIPNPDPANLIQRVWIHGDKIEVIDNIPIEEARKLFEEEAKQPKKEEVLELKNKIEKTPDYLPEDKDLEILKDWIKNPEIYLDEEQLKKIYDYPQGNIWDFFLHAIEKRKIPSLEERIEKGFFEYIKRTKFNDDQIKVLSRMINILAQNYIKKRRLNFDDIFSSPVYEQIIGREKDLKKIFPNNFENVLKDLESIIN